MRNNGAVIFMYGVHGSGKTLLAKTFSEDFNLYYISTNDIEKVLDVSKLKAIDRELVFSYHMLKNTVMAYRLASDGNIAIVDFGPAQIEAYTKWWLRNNVGYSTIKMILDWNYRKLRDIYPNIKIIHVFLLISNDEGYDTIIKRIISRNKTIVQEEANKDYIRFIDNELRKTARDLRRRGERVHILPADKPYIEKYKMLHNALSDILRINRHNI